MKNIADKDLEQTNMARKRRKRSYTFVKSASRPIIRFRFKVVVIIMLIVTAICFVLYMTGMNFAGDETGSYTVTWKEHKEESSSLENLDSSEKSDPSENSNNSGNPVPESAAMSQTYFGKCVFVGDSITVGLSDYQLVPMKNVMAEVGMNIEKINTEKMNTAYGETTILEALKQASPENVYIMLGSNGIGWLTIDEMIAEYSEFTENIKKSLPDTNIYILSIPPVTQARETSDEPVSNENIEEYNSRLLELANKNNYYYVDVHSALKNSDGVLSEEDAADDGMHFNKATYDKMVKYILSHVAK